MSDTTLVARRLNTFVRPDPLDPTPRADDPDDTFNRVLRTANLSTPESTALHRRLANEVIQGGGPAFLFPQDRRQFKSRRTPTERVTGFDFIDGGLDLARGIGRFGMDVGGEFLRSLNPFEGDISDRERAFRFVNVAAFFLPPLRMIQLGRAVPALRPFVATAGGRAAVRAAETGTVTALIESFRPPEERDIVIAGALGGVLGAGVETVLGRGARIARALRTEEATKRFRSTTEMLDRGRTPLLTEDYAVLSAQRAGLPDAQNAARHMELGRSLEDLGYGHVPLKMSDGRDGFLIAGMDDSVAGPLGRSLGQETVITRRGRLNLADEVLEPLEASKLRIGQSARGGSENTVLLRTEDGGLFQVEFAFDADHPVRLGGAFDEPAKDTLEALKRVQVEENIGQAERIKDFARKLSTTDARSWWTTVYRKSVRFFGFVENLERAVAGAARRDRPIRELPSRLIQLARSGHTPYAEAAVRHHLADFDNLAIIRLRPLRSFRPGEGIFEGESPSALIDVLQKVTPDEMEDYVAYGFARRFRELGERFGEKGPPTNPRTGRPFTVDELDEVIAGAPAHFEQIFDGTVAWRNEFLNETLVKSGIITQDQFNAIVTGSKDAIPLMRAIDAVAEQARLADKTVDQLAIFDPVKRLQRGGDKFVPWTTLMLQRAFLYSRLAHQQRALNGLIDLVNEAGPENLTNVIRRVKQPPKELSKQTREIIASLQDTDPALAKAVEAFDETVLSVVSPNSQLSSSAGFIRRLADGQPEWWEIIDEGLWDAVRGMGPVELNWYAKLGRPFASVLRAGATGFSPEFLARNPVRDFFFAVTSAGLDPLNWVRGFASLVRKDQFFEEWFARGGPRAALVSIDRPALSNEVRRLVEGGTRLGNVIRHPIETLRAISEFTESGTRLGVYRKTLSQELASGADPFDAMQAAIIASREGTVDFAVHGSATASLRLTAAFWGAQVQGVDRFRRALIENPARALTGAAAGITLPSVMLYMVNRDDPEYFQLPDWERNLFWHIKVPDAMANLVPTTEDQWIRIPKPFEPGILFGSLVERFLEAVDEDDPRVLDQLARDQFIETGREFLPIPTIAAPILEIMMNRSLLTGERLEPRGVEDIEPAFRTTQATSYAAKMIGEMTGLSPIRVDQMFRGYGGTVGRILADMTTYAEEVMDPAAPSAPDRRPGETPVVRAFFSRFPANAQSIDDFYKLAERTRRAVRTASRFEDSLMIDDYVDWVTTQAEFIGMEPATRRIADQLARLRSQRQLILVSRSLDARTKRRILDTLDDQTLTLVNSFLQAVPRRTLERI